MVGGVWFALTFPAVWFALLFPAVWLLEVPLVPLAVPLVVALVGFAFASMNSSRGAFHLRKDCPNWIKGLVGVVPLAKLFPPPVHELNVSLALHLPTYG